MSTATPTDDVTDSIAYIEMHRQEMAKEAGHAAACGEALRKLHELLEQERAALQLHGPDTSHPANIEAVALEIKRVKQLTGGAKPGANSRKARFRPQPAPRSHAPHNPARNKGRRTMGRRGDR